MFRIVITMDFVLEIIGIILGTIITVGIILWLSIESHKADKSNKIIADLLIKQSEGKTIQVQMKSGEWRDVLITEEDLNCNAKYYRIKPE